MPINDQTLEEFFDMVERVDTSDPMQAKAMAIITQQFFLEEAVKNSLKARYGDKYSKDEPSEESNAQNLTMIANMTASAADIGELLSVADSMKKIMSLSSLKPLMDPKVVYGRIVSFDFA